MVKITHFHNQIPNTSGSNEKDCVRCMTEYSPIIDFYII